MAISVSPEFVKLCQAQLALLAQSLQVSLSVVYLAEEWSEGPQASLFPVAAYPETEVGQTLAIPAHLPLGKSYDANSNSLLALPQSLENQNFEKRQVLASVSTPRVVNFPIAQEQMAEMEGKASLHRSSPPPQSSQDHSCNPEALQHQVILPLQQEGFVLGFLMVGREKQDWTEQEYAQLDQVVQTLTLACCLDRQLQWTQQQYQQQEIAQERQQDILDTLLHQFKNPLTALRTFSKLLLRRLGAGDRNQTVVEGMVRESDRLQFLLEQINRNLDPSHGPDKSAPIALPPGMPRKESESSDGGAMDNNRMDNNNSIGGNTMGGNNAIGSLLALPPSTFASNVLVGNTFSLEACALASILRPLADSARAIAQERKLDFHYQIPPPLPPVVAQAQALTEVCNNLIENALKYTPRNGEITLWAGLKPGEPQWQGVVVSNTGALIPPEDLSKLFQKHYRGVQTKGTIEGSGLGLAIVKELVEQMHGEVEVRSPAGPWYPKVLRGEEIETRIDDSLSGDVGVAFLVWLPIWQLK
jgi:signal transduction histidine kinase